MLPYYYGVIKTRESYSTAETLKKAFYDSNFAEEMRRLADEREMRIEVIALNAQSGVPEVYIKDPQNRFIFAQMPALALDKTITDEVKKSANGVVYRSEQSNDGRSYLLLTTYTGDRENPDAYITIYNYIEPLVNTTSILKNQFFLNVIILIIVAAILSAIVTSAVSNPIIRIALAAKKLATGEFKMDTNNCGYSEIRILTNALNKASSEIASADNLRRDLIANVSHDLKTPLTMIKAYAEMIRDLSGDNPQKRDYHLNVIIGETDRLNALVTDMLDLSKLQSGTAELSKTKFDLSEHLGDIAARYNALDERGYEIVTAVQPGIVVTADKRKLEQAICNIINNAINYTGTDGKVFLSLKRLNDETSRLMVVDTGLGIPKEELDLIWERYYKANKSENHCRTKGSGLGLSIVKGIFESHGYRYGAESELGKGSTFWVEITE
jgi:signal transduction histidine kinase